MAVFLTGCNKMKEKTVVFYPAAYDTTNYSYASISNANNPVGKGPSNTTYAQINLKTGNKAETYVFFPFDLSAIPKNATIVSVSCTAKGYISITSEYASGQMQLYAGSTAKGVATTLTQSETTWTLTGGTWTRAELENFRLRLYAQRTLSLTTSSFYLRFYGAELTVTYI